MTNDIKTKAAAALQIACAKYLKTVGFDVNRSDIDIAALRMMRAARNEYEIQVRMSLLAEACSCLNGFHQLYDEHDPAAKAIIDEFNQLGEYQ